ncbi:Protein of unknown function, partial [Gryllus bimaculatus]
VHGAARGGTGLLPSAVRGDADAAPNRLPRSRTPARPQSPRAHGAKELSARGARRCRNVNDATRDIGFTYDAIFWTAGSYVFNIKQWCGIKRAGQVKIKIVALTLKADIPCRLHQLRNKKQNCDKVNKNVFVQVLFYILDIMFLRIGNFFYTRCLLWYLELFEFINYLYLYINY